MTDTMVVEAGFSSYEVKVDSINLYIEHDVKDCKCHAERIVQATVEDINYNVFVPYCVAHNTRSPILAACDKLEQHTGYKILSKNRVESILREYSNEPVGKFLRSPHDLEILEFENDAEKYEFDLCRPVIHGTFGNDYYLKRNVFKWILTGAVWGRAKKKCDLCGTRDCEDNDCSRMTESLSQQCRETSEGYVYFLLHPATLQLKVGTTVNPKKRIQTHRSANSGEIKVIGIVKGSPALENSIHYDLRSMNVRIPGKKEWFFYTEQVKEYTDRLISCIENYKEVDK